MFMKSKLSIFILALFSNTAFAQTAQMCTTCSTESSARSFAKAQANPLDCSPTFDENIQCSSRSKEVLLVDETTGNSYRFNVFHEQQAPWNLRAERLGLNADAEEAYRILMQFHKDLNAAIIEASGTYGAVGSLSQHPITKQDQLNNTVSANSGNCPTNTALTTILDPNKLSELRTVALSKIGTGLVSRNNRLNLKPTKVNRSYGLAYKGAQYTMTSDGGPIMQSYAETFPQSERTTSLSDVLVFEANISAYTSDGMPAASLVINEGASRVAGFSLSELKGGNGPLLVDNECLKERFEEAAALGIVSMKTTDIGSGGTGTGQPSGGDNGLPSHPGGIATSCQLVEFFQNGHLQYTFRICE